MDILESLLPKEYFKNPFRLEGHSEHVQCGYVAAGGWAPGADANRPLDLLLAWLAQGSRERTVASPCGWRSRHFGKPTPTPTSHPQPPQVPTTAPHPWASEAPSRPTMMLERVKFKTN